MIIRIGGSEREFVLITVHGYLYPAAFDPYAGEWLDATIAIQAGGWTGTFGTELTLSELIRFRKQLVSLATRSSHEARFESLEDQLRLTLTGDALGHITVEGIAHDYTGTGSTLTFTLMEIDQSYLPSIISQIGVIERRFPRREQEPE